MRKIFFIFIVVLIFFGLGFLGYTQVAVNNGLGNTSAINCERNPTPGKFGATPYYSGPLFETHLHIPSVLPPPKIIRDKLGLSQEYAVLGDQITIEKIVCLMDRENIIRAVSFFPLVDFPFIRKPFVDIAKRTVAIHKERIIPFVGPVPFVDPAPAPSTLKKIFDQRNNVFKGYGEVPFYWNEFKNLSPDSPQFLESYNLLGERGLAVMIHPAFGQESALRKAFTENPNVSFILHSNEIENSLNSILEEYPNVFYTLDNILPTLFEVDSKEEFMKKTRERFNEMLNSAVYTWKPRIEDHPEQFMWGTDRFTTFSYDEEVGKVIEEFYRAFIGRLSPRVQELYAYKNAEKLFED